MDNNQNNNSNNIANTFQNGSVFKQSGGSHITTHDNSAHITIPIGGLKQGIPIQERVDVPIKGY